MRDGLLCQQSVLCLRASRGGPAPPRMAPSSPPSTCTPPCPAVGRGSTRNLPTRACPRGTDEMLLGCCPPLVGLYRKQCCSTADSRDRPLRSASARAGSVAAVSCC